jgi:hypothetical protein
VSLCLSCEIQWAHLDIDRAERREFLQIERDEALDAVAAEEVRHRVWDGRGVIQDEREPAVAVALDQVKCVRGRQARRTARRCTSAGAPPSPRAGRSSVDGGGWV